MYYKSLLSLLVAFSFLWGDSLSAAGTRHRTENAKRTSLAKKRNIPQANKRRVVNPKSTHAKSRQFPARVARRQLLSNVDRRKQSLRGGRRLSPVKVQRRQQAVRVDRKKPLARGIRRNHSLQGGRKLSPAKVQRRQHPTRVDRRNRPVKIVRGRQALARENVRRTNATSSKARAVVTKRSSQNDRKRISSARRRVSNHVQKNRKSAARHESKNRKTLVRKEAKNRKSVVRHVGKNRKSVAKAVAKKRASLQSAQKKPVKKINGNHGNKKLSSQEKRALKQAEKKKKSAIKKQAKVDAKKKNTRSKPVTSSSSPEIKIVKAKNLTHAQRQTLRELYGSLDKEQAVIYWHPDAKKGTIEEFIQIRIEEKDGKRVKKKSTYSTTEGRKKWGFGPFRF